MKTFSYILPLFLLACGGGQISLPPSMLGTKPVASISSATVPVIGPGWKLDLDYRWHSINPGDWDDGMLHLFLDREPISSNLFSTAIQHRRDLIAAGWQARKDQTGISNGLAWYRFQVNKDEKMIWIILFQAGNQTQVLQCGGLTLDADHNRPICENVVNHLGLVK